MVLTTIAHDRLPPPAKSVPSRPELLDGVSQLRATLSELAALNERLATCHDMRRRGIDLLDSQRRVEDELRRLESQRADTSRRVSRVRRHIQDGIADAVWRYASDLDRMHQAARRAFSAAIEAEQPVRDQMLQMEADRDKFMESVAVNQAGQHFRAGLEWHDVRLAEIRPTHEELYRDVEDAAIRLAEIDLRLAVWKLELLDLPTTQLKLAVGASARHPVVLWEQLHLVSLHVWPHVAMAIPKAFEEAAKQAIGETRLTKS